jgi:hypothetical protein
MKKIFKNYLTLALSAVVLFASCKKDEVKLVAKQGTTPLLTASATTLNLLQAEQNNEAVTFSWSKQFWGVNTATVNYSLQFIKDGGNWNTPGLEVSMSELLTKKYTVGDFNKEMVKFLDPDVTVDVWVRVKSEIPNSIAITYSSAVKLTIRPYRDIIFYTFPAAMNIAGNYQGWDPGSAPQIVNAKNGGYAGYEGYINFGNPVPEFKVVRGNNWGAGDHGDGGGGTLTANGGPNLMLTNGAGVYRMRVNAARTTWSADKINTWGIIGSAIPVTGWNSSVAMTMGTDGNYSITTNLNAGEIKFRANNDWVIDFGDNAPANGEPDYGGANIQVASAGNYTIKLNIGRGGNYNYTIKKN